MKKNKIGKFITVFAIIIATIEIGMAIGCYMLLNIDFDKYDYTYSVEVVK